MNMNYLSSSNQGLKEYSRYEKLSYNELLNEVDQVGREIWRSRIASLIGLLGDVFAKRKQCCEAEGN